jgi:hypothetical protein
MQTESTLLVFEKVPTKGFKLDAVGNPHPTSQDSGWMACRPQRHWGHHILPDSKHEWDGGSVA